ncbi:MAG: LysM peptidoglycan-binding domain-containing protein [Bacillota bacterium]
MRLDEPLEKRLVTLAVCAQLFVLASILAMVFLSTTDPAFVADEPDKDVVVYVVQPGDSLWTIAQRFRPEEKPELVIAEIVSESRLPGYHVQAYQQIRIPTRRYQDG